jgi:hypothetical protein
MTARPDCLTYPPAPEPPQFSLRPFIWWMVVLAEIAIIFVPVVWLAWVLLGPIVAKILGG